MAQFFSYLFCQVGTFLVHLLPGRPDRMALAYVSNHGVTQHRIIFTKDGHVRLEDETAVIRSDSASRSPRTSIGAGGGSSGGSSGVNATLGAPEEANISLSAPVYLPSDTEVTSPSQDRKPEVFNSLLVRICFLFFSNRCRN